MAESAEIHYSFLDNSSPELKYTRAFWSTTTMHSESISEWAYSHHASDDYYHNVNRYQFKTQWAEEQEQWITKWTAQQFSNKPAGALIRNWLKYVCSQNLFINKIWGSCAFLQSLYETIKSNFVYYGFRCIVNFIDFSSFDFNYFIIPLYFGSTL